MVPGTARRRNAATTSGFVHQLRAPIANVSKTCNQAFDLVGFVGADRPQRRLDAIVLYVEIAPRARQVSGHVR